MNINKIAILGAGAVGASMVHQILSFGTSDSLSIIADGVRAGRYRRDGFRVNGETIRPDIVESGAFHLILVATKSYNLENALPLLDQCVSEDTLVMSLLNGIISETVLGDRYGHDRVIPAMILGIDALREDGEISYMNRGVIHYGRNPLAEDQQEKLSHLTDWFSRSGLGYKFSDEITSTLWRKFMINVGMNQTSAVLGAAYGRYQKDPETLEMMRQAMAEVVELSRLEGTGLKKSDIDNWIEILKTLDPEGKTSMLQDVEAGRRTEVEIFAGTVITLAARHGLEVPVNLNLQNEIIRIGNKQ